MLLVSYFACLDVHLIVVAESVSLLVRVKLTLAILRPLFIVQVGIIERCSLLNHLFALMVLEILKNALELQVDRTSLSRASVLDQLALLLRQVLLKLAVL